MDGKPTAPNAQSNGFYVEKQAQLLFETVHIPTSTLATEVGCTMMLLLDKRNYKNKRSLFLILLFILPVFCFHCFCCGLLLFSPMNSATMWIPRGMKPPILLLKMAITNSIRLQKLKAERKFKNHILKILHYILKSMAEN